MLLLPSRIILHFLLLLPLPPPTPSPTFNPPHSTYLPTYLLIPSYVWHDFTKTLRSNGRTDGRTNGHKDYRDARMRLKTIMMNFNINSTYLLIPMANLQYGILTCLEASDLFSYVFRHHFPPSLIFIPHVCITFSSRIQMLSCGALA